MFILSANIIGACVASLLVGLFFIPWLRAFSEKNQKLVDVAEGDELKIHKKPTSLLGGVGMAGAILIGFLMLWNVRVLPVAIGLLFCGGLGFWDDIAWKHILTIKPKVKFFWLLVCTFVPALLLAMMGMGFAFIPTLPVSAGLSFIYIFVTVNAVNYQDGMDGLAGGLVAISLVAFMVLSALAGNIVVFSVCLVTLAAVLAFLVFNLPPAKIFMGDCGSYALGFILAVSAMQFSKPSNVWAAVAPIVIIGMPIVDGVFTNIRRILNGKSIFLGDRSHFYDRLMQKGFSVKKTLAICYCLQIVLAAAGLLLYISYG